LTYSINLVRFILMKIFKYCLIIALSFCLLAGISFAQKLTPKEISRTKKEITRVQKEITRLKNKLVKTKNKKQRTTINDAINTYLNQVSKLKQKLAAKPAEVKAPPKIETAPAEAVLTPEAEEAVVPETKVEQKRIQVKFGVGALAGIFGGGSAYLGEMRFPLRIVIGPAVTSLRISTGYLQEKDLARKYIPINADLVFGFPPGWFTGTDNYIGFGLNYVALTTGRKAGTIGGQLFYGVESEGFGGIVFGEMGFGILRTGFSPSQKGLTILLGYRILPGF